MTVALKVDVLLHMCNPVQVGAIATERAGAPSLRKKVLADPFTAVSPTLAEGFAPVEVDEPAPSQATPTRQIVPEAFGKVNDLFSLKRPRKRSALFEIPCKAIVLLAPPEIPATKVVGSELFEN